ncbi:MAG: hypothetical protein H6R10_2736 [Rhodocyclaceae bacterium]|nr:hypothetical protein [Rhodocyclaceae bacterium]
MNKLLADWPRSADALLVEAKRESAAAGELVRLILAGNLHLDSWLIENRILPALQEKGIRLLRFCFTDPDRRKRSAVIVPLPDGSAFACGTDGFWSALDRREALDEIQYIGFRHAPDNHWHRGFQVTLEPVGGAPAPATPAEVANIWQETTGARPLGFGVGIVDQMEAFGLGIINKAFHTEGRLGL